MARSPALALVAALSALLPDGQALALPPALPAARLAELRAAQPLRANQARARLLSERSLLGLGELADFAPRSALTTPRGRTVIRLDQLHGGARVWGAQAITHVEPSGALRTLSAGVAPAVAVAGTPLLSRADAVAVALEQLGGRGTPLLPPRAELVVFPSRLTGGLATRFDEGRGREVFDPDLSVWARPPAAPYVWAYEVRTLMGGRAEGLRAWRFVIDATTGAVLRKLNGLQSAAAAHGVGHGYYNPEVTLDTVQADDGTFELRSLSRGTLPNPFWLDFFGVSLVGLTTTFDAYQVGVPGDAETLVPYAGRATNTWGDGLNFAGFELERSADGTLDYLSGATGPNGESAAVDAHFGLSTTWDFYLNVFGRRGIDDLDTTTYAVVHLMEGSLGGRYDNAFWNDELFGMFFGDGTYPQNEGGFRSLTELDITGHELTHGVTSNSAGLIYSGESGGLNEATSDIFGKMVQAYATRPAGADAEVPDFAPGDLEAWMLGLKAGGGNPLRAMYHPSLDGWSPDAWYDGIELTDVHFSSGPLNRMFYFLTSGASPDPAAETYSPYLPAGMAGIGNDRAARIWYAALTEYLVPESDYAAAREAALQAAEALYGAASAESEAVMRAFAAVNVGSAPGERPRVRVTVPLVHPPSSIIGGDHTQEPGILGKVQIFPTLTPVRVSVTVENAADTSVTVALPPRTDGQSGGAVRPDGTWITPGWTYSTEFLALEVRSNADPLQFAKLRTFVVEVDADTDGERDAFDLGTVAMAWGLLDSPRPAALVASPGVVGDWDLVWFTEALRNGWPAR